MSPKSLISRVPVLQILILMTGCSSRDERLAEYAERASAQQARQNETMARQSEQVAKQSAEVASAARELVNQDATARRDLLHAQEQLQQQHHEQQAGLDQQRQELHTEREAAVKAAQREPVIAQALIVVGVILAALLPLIVTAYALRRLPDTSTSETLLANELWIDLSALPNDLSPSGPPALPPNGPEFCLPAPGPSTDSHVAN
jgi:hypothetical protein